MNWWSTHDTLQKPCRRSQRRTATRGDLLSPVLRLLEKKWAAPIVCWFLSWKFHWPVCFYFGHCWPNHWVEDKAQPIVEDDCGCIDSTSWREKMRMLCKPHYFHAFLKTHIPSLYTLLLNHSHHGQALQKLISKNWRKTRMEKYPSTVWKKEVDLTPQGGIDGSAVWTTRCMRVFERRLGRVPLTCYNVHQRTWMVQACSSHLHRTQVFLCFFFPNSASFPVFGSWCCLELQKLMLNDL